MRRGGMLAVAVAAALAAGAAGAWAGNGPVDPETAPLGTGYTPVPRETPSSWKQVAGATFPDTSVPDGSVTPYDLDFYAVSFFSDEAGFAGGAVCKTPVPSDQTAGCERVPVIYRYTAPDGEQPKWEEVYRGTTDGYVGSIAWIGPNRALAVGGTGCYPRREEPCPGSSGPQSGDPAGDGRAWLYDPARYGDQSWHDLGGDLPAHMGGLTTVAFSPHDPGQGFAGGYRQLWQWQDDHFARGYFPDSAEVIHGEDFIYRVRKVVFDGWGDALAVTSGCCESLPTGTAAPTPAGSQPQLLVWHDGQWAVGHLHGWDSGLENDPTVGPERQGTNHARTALADSFYDVQLDQRLAGAWFLVSPGGQSPDGALPDLASEPASRILRERSPNQGVLGTLLDLFLEFGDGDPVNGAWFATDPIAPGGLTPVLSSARLVAADGEVDDPLHWAVGVLRSSGQGIAFDRLATDDAGRSQLTTCAENGGTPPTPNCTPDDVQTEVHAYNAELFKLTSWGLNAYDKVDGSDTGWAVGDHGAIERFGEGTVAVAGGAGREPAPPQLGPASEGSLPETGAFDAFRPLPSAEPGEVPALASRPLEALPQPSFVPGGVTQGDHVTQIAMSRDGHDGWAVGPTLVGAGGHIAVLYHYDGTTWSRCDPDAPKGVVDVDPACASLLSLLHPPGGPIELRAVTRIPLENDDDPSNDDDFELVATGSLYRLSDGSSHPTILRYRDGRWTMDTQAMAQLGSSRSPVDVAFAAPDDGWMVGPGDQVTGPPVVLHFDGRNWVDCNSTDPAVVKSCGNESGRLPFGDLAVPGPVDGGMRLHVLAAGDRVYMWGSRVQNSNTSLVAPGAAWPMVIYEDHASGGGWTAADGGYDPLFDNPAGNPDDEGQIAALSVARGQDGRYTGWAAGSFGGGSGAAGIVPASSNAHLLHLGADGAWRKWSTPDAAADYLVTASAGGTGRSTLPAPRGLVAMPDGSAYLAPTNEPMLRFDPHTEAWQIQPTPWVMTDDVGTSYSRAPVDAMAADGAGGVWAAVPTGTGGGENPGFYDLADTQHKPVLDEVASHFLVQPTAAAAGGDGSFWVATQSDTLYRYDRLTGWDRVSVPGWDPGKFVTRSSPAYAIAVGADGTGVAVGDGGRIADLAPRGTRLDAAAGTICDLADVAPPCGTGRTLRAAGVAPDGSAMVGGDAVTLLWRPPGGDFRAIVRPKAAFSARVTGIALPAANRAYVATDTGQIWAGDEADGNWHWRLEDRSPDRQLLTLDDNHQPQALRAIAVDAAGRGFAVGDNGIILARVDDSDTPWRRLRTRFAQNLRSVALSANGGPGALIGGDNGLILTMTGGNLEVARPADPYNPLTGARSSPDGLPGVIGLGLLAGVQPGEVEAWAVATNLSADGSRAGSGSVLLHYASDPNDPLLQPDGRATPLPDSPAPRPGEITFASFGKQDCEFAAKLDRQCPEMAGSMRANEVIARQVDRELIAGAGKPGGAEFALFTGDAGDASGSGYNTTATPLDESMVHRRWIQYVVQPLMAAGVPVFGAIGGQDLAQAEVCGGDELTRCRGSRVTGFGPNLPWRQALAPMPRPWGSGDPAQSSGLAFRPVETSDIAAPGGGANTHYALDVVRGGKSIMRLVVVDSSERSLTADDPQQNPLAAGGQATWLQQVLCTRGDTTSTTVACTRDPGEPIVVVSNTPTYSYGPGALTDTQDADATSFESLLFSNHVSAVVSGRLGWNGLYWATAPGVHEPCPGGAYETGVPDSGTRICGETADSTAPTGNVSASLRSLGAPPPPQVSGTSVAGVIPFVVAASAGGKFGPDGQSDGTAADGYWHGYTIVRLAADGDPRKLIVEQRPVFDFVGIRAVAHALQPGQRMLLRGYGREPVGIDGQIRYDDIDGPAVTHRYDLLEADPDKPYLPRRDASGNYVPLDPSVASIDGETGRVTAGRSNHPRIYALAELSVGDNAATFPLVFEPARSYVPPRPSIVVAPALPQVRVLGLSAAMLQAPPAAAPPQTPPPINTSLQVPPPPPLPVFPTASAPPIAPPAPPAPPPPPGSQSAIPLNLSVAPVGIAVPPTPGVTAQPTPPVQPAPPSGARREAKQRQAATAKSEESSSEGAQQLGGDRVDGPPLDHGSKMTRRDRVRPGVSFTPLAHDAQPSAWVTGLEWGGGIGLAALALALGFATVRPTPRRRRPVVPAPARSFSTIRRR